jgi:uncharacterized membrane protein
MEEGIMYAFGMVVLLGLAVLVVAKIGNHYLRQIPGAWAATLVALGVGAAWLTNLNLFSIWSIPVRNSDIAVTLTGILIAGAGYCWREVLGMFGGLYRKYTDEAKLMENSETLRRVA